MPADFPPAEAKLPLARTFAVYPFLSNEFAGTQNRPQKQRPSATLRTNSRARTVQECRVLRRLPPPLGLIAARSAGPNLLLRLADGDMDAPVADLAAFQRRGHRLQESVAAVDRERRGRDHNGVELLVGEGGDMRRGKIGASASGIKAPQHESERRQWARKAALLPKALALCSFTQNVR